MSFPSARPSAGFALLQLLRLPNVFTAVADVAMGFLVTHGDLQPAGLFALLAVASSSLYLAGMVLNDVFDVEVDTRERPERPIPSGRVPLPRAQALGWALLVGGVLLGWLAGYSAGNWRPGIVATLLAACVVLYDWTLKRTPIAPLLMGTCRMFNVLLGMSLAASSGTIGAAAQFEVPRQLAAGEWMIAIGIGIYIAGVTSFARTEARASSRWRLAVSTGVMLAGLWVVAAVPLGLVGAGPISRLLWAVLTLMIGWRCIAAVAQPTPARVQPAVRNAVQAIIVIDAAVCVGLVSASWGLAVLMLMAPTIVLTQWLKST